jgi:hypothetical protein
MTVYPVERRDGKLLLGESTSPITREPPPPYDDGWSTVVSLWPAVVDDEIIGWFATVPEGVDVHTAPMRFLSKYAAEKWQE